MARGRPKIQIDKKEFEDLCGLQCTLEEIAATFHCSPDTIERWCKREYKQTFAEVFGVYRGIGNISLRRIMRRHAEHNAVAAMFLCKNQLGMCDDPRKYEQQTADAAAPRQVIIINDTIDDESDDADSDSADTDKPADNS